MTISVVIPVYNVELQIADCLQSVMNQTWCGDIECIVIDDCGTDKSMSIAKKMIGEYSGDISFHIISHEKNLGLSAARNTGIKTAKGDYVFFLDSDDCITADCLALLSEPLRNFKYDFVIGDYNLNGIDIGYPKLTLSEGTVFSSRRIMETLSDSRDGWYVMAWNKLCNIDFLRKHRIYFEEGILHEDELWSCILSYYAESMYVVKSKTYRYFVRNNSIITDPLKQKKRLEGLLQVFVKENELLLNANHNEDLLIRIIYSHAHKILFLSIAKGISPYHFYQLIRKGNKVNFIDSYIKKEIPFSLFLKNMHFYMPNRIGFWGVRLHYYISGRKKGCN